MLHMKKRAVVLAGLVVVTAGCSILGQSEPPPTLAIAPPLNPYQSTTGTPGLPTPTTPPATAQTLFATPTPFKHIIQAGDTLYGIALLYNISFDKLVSANPSLDSSALIVGTEVNIPFGEDDELGAPTPTPYPLLKGDPVCFPTTDGGIWCYALVENNQPITLENISLAFYTTLPEQDQVIRHIAYAPLNILQPGQKIALGMLFPDTEADQIQQTTTLMTAYPSEQTEPQVLISDQSLVYTQENTVVQVTGTFEILSGHLQGDQVWIAGIGYSAGKPAAVRKWVSPEGLEAGASYPFDFQLYSLGPEIDEVQLLAELH